MLQKVTKAIIPAAGYGTRMLPLTKDTPKEMLPVHRKPMIHHVVEEAVASGIEQVCVVIRKGKDVIRHYFENQEHPLPYYAEGIPDLENLRDRCKIFFLYQETPRGIGDALLCAKDFVANDSFAMLVPDQLFVGDTPPIMQLQRHELPGPCIVSSLIRLSDEQFKFFQGARRFVCEDLDEYTDVMAITRIVADEDETQDDGDPMVWPRGFGRTIFPPEIFPFLGEDFANSHTGEVDLMKTFDAAIGEVKNYGVYLEGEVFDLGTLASYRNYLPRLSILIG